MDTLLVHVVIHWACIRSNALQSGRVTEIHAIDDTTNWNTNCTNNGWLKQGIFERN